MPRFPSIRNITHPTHRHRVHLALALVAFVAGCTPSIGDQCVLSTDCSTRGDRLCDTSQPAGYCTEFNCSKNSCPDEAVCVLFNAGIPGCGYDDHAGAYGSRIARSFCVKMCANNGDCRGGYVCADPHLQPWNGLVYDDDQSKLTCLVPPNDYGVDAGPDAMLFTPGPPAPICGKVGPDVPKIDAGAAHITEAGAVAPPPLFMDSGGTDAADAGDASDAADAGDGDAG